MDTRITIPVDPSWVGRSITGEGGRSDDLRAAIRAAQRQVLTYLDPPASRDFHIRWEVGYPDGFWHWNPQTNLGEGAREIHCIGEWELK